MNASPSPGTAPEGALDPGAGPAPEPPGVWHRPPRWPSAWLPWRLGRRVTELEAALAEARVVMRTQRVVVVDHLGRDRVTVSADRGSGRVSVVDRFGDERVAITSEAQVGAVTCHAFGRQPITVTLFAGDPDGDPEGGAAIFVGGNEFARWPN